MACCYYVRTVQRGQQGQQRALSLVCVGGGCGRVHACVLGSGVFIWPEGAIGFLLIGLVQQPGASRVSGGKTQQEGGGGAKSPDEALLSQLRHMATELWDHTECSRGGSNVLTPTTVTILSVILFLLLSFLSPAKMVLLINECFILGLWVLPFTQNAYSYITLFRTTVGRK